MAVGRCWGPGTVMEATRTLPSVIITTRPGVLVAPMTADNSGAAAKESQNKGFKLNVTLVG